MNEQVYNEIDPCILKYHTDMFYNSIPGSILSFEYGHDGSGKNELPVTKDELISRLQIVSAFIHEQVIGTGIPGINFTDEQREKWSKTYRILLQRGRMYDQVISTHLIQNAEIGDLVNRSFGNDDEYINYTKFSQQCMHIGYLRAGHRVVKSKNEQTLFGHETYKDLNNNVIKVYLTIDGYLSKMHLIKKTNKELNEALNSYLESHNIYRFTPDDLVAELKTRYIFKSLDTGECFYYKRRENNLDYIKFDEQDRKDPMVALIGQGQMNLTLVPY